jgi:hypothetical protein
MSIQSPAFIPTTESSNRSRSTLGQQNDRFLSGHTRTQVARRGLPKRSVRCNVLGLDEGFADLVGKSGGYGEEVRFHVWVGA